jgi:protein-L-isoaspartate(D-aspartate) O-methyltransferase
MNVASFDFDRARALMIDGQLRPNKVADAQVLSAMGALPRERFLPTRLRAYAYIDEDVALGNGRFLLAPLAIARLIQLAEPRAGERALVVGAGTGYGAAVLSACNVRVTALDENAELLAAARTTLQELAPSAVVVSGPLAEGWPGGAPWDIVVIEGATDAVPPKLAAQVRKDGGRLIGVRLVAGGIGQAVIGEPSTGGLAVRTAFDCAVPELPGLRATPQFIF